MKGNRIIAVFVFAFATIFPLTTHADNGWYGAVDLGQSNFTDLGNPNGPFFFKGQKNSDHDTSYRLVAGYQFNPYFSLEAGYVDLGGAETDGHYAVFAGFGSGGQPVYRYVPFSEKVKADGYVAEAVGNLPLGTAWALYGRLGTIEVNTSDSPVNGIPIIGRSGADTDITFGTGVSWARSDRLKFRFGWDAYDTLGSKKTGKYSVHVLGLGLVYSFQ